MILALLLAQMPNIYVIMADDFAASDMAVVSTPNLDALAAQGVTFTRAYSNPNCTPSRASLLLGDWSDEILLAPCSAGTDVAIDPWTLPKMMDEAGYNTGLFGKWHYGSNAIGYDETTPHLLGFNVWHAGTLGNTAFCGSTDYWDWQRVDDGVVTNSTTYNTYEIRAAFLAWRATSSPGFALVSFNTPHAPFHVPPSQPVVTGNRPLYEGMVRDMDLTIGVILASINLTQDWVIFIGDNGTPKNARQPGQEAGKVKHSVFKDGVRVPMIFAGPGLPMGETADALVHLADIGPTIAEALGLDVPVGKGGMSFLDVLGNTSDPGPRSYVYCSRGVLGTSPRERAVVTVDYKLRELGSVQELYDLPDEDTDVIDDPTYAAVLATLRGYLANHP
jgi:arylsulfatase A-like enzyme